MMFFSFLCFHTSQVLLDWPKGKFICSSVLKVKTFPNVYKVTACSLALRVLTIPPFAREQNLTVWGTSALGSTIPSPPRSGCEQLCIVVFVAVTRLVTNGGKGTGATDWWNRWGLVASNEISRAIDLFSDSGGVPAQAHLEPEDGFARVMGKKEREVGVYYLPGISLICT